MMAQEGFIYESKAYAALEAYGISTGGTAGASHDRPDLTIKNAAGKSTGCELKNQPTAAGSLVMKYYAGSWGFGDFGDDPEKAFMYGLATKAKLLTEMNKSGNAGRNWRGKVPALQNDARGKKILAPGFTDKKKAYEYDLKQFGGPNEVHLEVGGKAVSDYYNSKKTYYINVGSHGFYLLNNSDPLGLNAKLRSARLEAIPQFNTSAKCKIRVRCQYKGGGDYQFVMTLQFYGVKASPYNIAPLRPGSNSDIDTAKLKQDPILLAFR
jgi:hypothetical protein